jgi:hypothetical protein
MSKFTTVKKLTSFIGAALLFTLTFTACKKSSGSTNNSGDARTSMGATDAAIDDASVSGVFVTITDIKLDGQSIQGFNKTTINLAAFKNGNIKNIGNYNLEGKSYSTLTFVLDYAKDSSGNAPGAYVLTTDNVKHALTSNTNSITISKNFTLQTADSNAIVADFDLRKMITHPATGDTASFTFVTSSELQNSVRFVNARQSSIVSGLFNNTIYASDTVIAYVYKQGAYTSAELQGQGASSIQFANAVTSSIVAADGSYKLSFLDSGNYEIHFISYKDLNNNGQLSLQGTFTSSATGSINVLGFAVGSNTTVTINATATSIVSAD